MRRDPTSTRLAPVETTSSTTPWHLGHPWAAGDALPSIKEMLSFWWFMNPCAYIHIYIPGPSNVT